MATKLGTAKKSEHEKERRRDIEGDRASERVKSICLEQVTAFFAICPSFMYCQSIGSTLCEFGWQIELTTISNKTYLFIYLL